MLCRLFSIVAAMVIWMVTSLPAYAADIDAYVLRYLKATEPVPIAVNGQGDTRLFSAQDLSEGKRLFKDHCLNCHVGGTTLPDPTVSLSLSDLHGATPPRDNLDGFVAYLRQPMVYDGSMETYWCRQVSENWMPSETIDKLAAFVIRAAETSPGWGNESLNL